MNFSSKKETISSMLSNSSNKKGTRKVSGSKNFAIFHHLLVSWTSLILVIKLQAKREDDFVFYCRSNEQNCWKEALTMKISWITWNIGILKVVSVQKFFDCLPPSCFEIFNKVLYLKRSIEISFLFQTLFFILGDKRYFRERGSNQIVSGDRFAIL